MRMRLLVVGIGFAFLTAACGGSAATTNGKPGSGSATATVAVRQVAGVGKVLTGRDGHSLYFLDHESSGHFLCTGACTSTWPPLAATGSPVAGPGLSGTLGMVMRPDGTQQVTFQGHPLYAFAHDSAPGQTNGNGITGTFQGVTATWHVATSAGAVATSPSSGSGGYGY